MLVENILDNIYAFRLARLLMTDWVNWPAYKHGIIDENGKRTDKPNRGKAKAHWGFFQRGTANIKRMIEKIPGGKNKLIKALAVFKLFAESTSKGEELILKYAEEQANLIIEAATAGDAGGDSTKIASGENSGNVVNGGSGGRVIVKPKKKKKIKTFLDFIDKDNV